MLQRIQSIWFLLASLFSAVTFRFPFYSGERVAGVSDTAITTTPSTNNFADTTVRTAEVLSGVTDLNATTSIWLTILTVITGAIAFVTIFLFDNRKLQLKLSYLGIFLTMILLVMYFLEVGNYTEGNVAIWAIFYFAILAMFILAARGVWKDQKLLKDMNRLR
jgi:heme exporter protein D